MTLSLAMIVKNEEFVISNCLSSVRGLVDEMVLVDTGSTDYTKIIAKTIGAKVIDFEWVDDFSAARNESLKYCTSDWILVLDADESIDLIDHQTIREAILREEVDAFNIPIRNYLANKQIMMMDKTLVRNKRSRYKEGRGFPYYAQHDGMRLFRKLNDNMYEGKIHETVDQFFIDNGSKIEGLEVAIHHFGKMLFDKENSKTPVYLKMAEEEAEAQPDNPRVWYNVFQQALVADDHKSVLNAAKNYLRINHLQAPAIIYIGSAMALRGLGRFGDAIICLDAVLNLEPDNKLALKYKKEILKTMKADNKKDFRSL